MGKHSNIILLDMESGKIIDSIKRISIDLNRVRQILPGKIYEYPPAQDKIPFGDVTIEDLEKICCCTPSALPKALLNGIQGISPLVAQELCHGLDISSEIPYGPDEIAETTQIAYTNLCRIKELLSSEELSPRVYINSETQVPTEFHAFSIHELENACEIKEFSTLSEATEYFYSNRSTSNNP